MTGQADGLEAPESAVEWAKIHYIAYADFSDGGADIGRRAATWRDAPTTWGEASDHYRAHLAATLDAAREDVARAIEADRDAEIERLGRTAIRRSVPLNNWIGGFTAAAKTARAARLTPTDGAP